VSGRRFEVRGTDDFGDVHIFRTDNRGRAEQVEALMRDRLEEVELDEREAARTPA
jgi:hypothetical protein